MIRYRHLIPFLFFILSFFGCVYGAMSPNPVSITKKQAVLNPGDSVTLDPQKLHPDWMYTAYVRVTGVYADGTNATVVATLLDEEDEELFELEDSWWSESGVWHEDGQSGTWHEENTLTRFNFRVPKPGTFKLRVSLAESRLLSGTPKDQHVTIHLRHSQPHLIGTWPMAIAVIVFFVFTIIAYRRREHHTREVLKTLGQGSEITIEDVQYTVADVRVHSEATGENVYELRLSPKSGSRERYISTDWLEEEYEDSEGNDQIRYHKYILIDHTAPDDITAQFEASYAAGHAVQFQGMHYAIDPENSGRAHQVTILDDQTYRSKYSYDLYRNGYPATPGEFIIERIVNEKGDDVEWAISRVLDWSDISFDSIIESTVDPTNV